MGWVCIFVEEEEEEDAVNNNKERGVRAFVFFLTIFAISSHDFLRDVRKYLSVLTYVRKYVPSRYRR